MATRSPPSYQHPVGMTLKGTRQISHQELNLIKHRLYERGQDKERDAVKVVMSLPFLANRLWYSLGLGPNSVGDAAWFLLESKTWRLVGREPEADCPGDIDIIAGRLEPNIPRKEFDKMLAENPGLAQAPQCSPFLLPTYLMERGLITWPPCLDYLVAVEVRVCTWKENRPFGFKGEIIRYSEKASRLADLGFDRAMLLHLISIQPHFGFFESLRQAEAAENQLRQTPFSAATEMVGEAIWPLGSVCHKEESQAGAGGPSLIREPTLVETHTPRQREVRSRIEQRLKEEFSNLPSPQKFPIHLTWKGNHIKAGSW